MAFGNKRPYSYTDQKKRMKKVWLFLRLFLILFLSYEVLTGIFLSPYKIASKSMSPTINPSDLILTSPIVYGPKIPFGNIKLFGFTKPARGDIVLVEAPMTTKNEGFLAILDDLVQFITFQQLSLSAKDTKNWEKSALVKRVIAVPGDVIYMKDFIFYIKEQDTEHFLTEFEVSGRSYDTDHEKVPENWTSDLPFSGDYQEIRLNSDEYFVSGDMRSITNDSRSFGPVNEVAILAPIVLRYWPFSAFGRP